MVISNGITKTILEYHMYIRKFHSEVAKGTSVTCDGMCLCLCFAHQINRLVLENDRIFRVSNFGFD